LKKEVLITVKTYPLPTSRYDESVCTAGFTRDKKWIRIYPIKFRNLPYSSQYKKYDWIEIDVEKNLSDFRAESFRPLKLDIDITISGHINTDSNWYERKQIVLNNVEENMQSLIKDAKDKSKYKSLSVFKPKEIIDFHATSTSREWGVKKQNILAQGNLFDRNGELIKKLPYKFFFKFIDIKNKECNMMIEDWEIGELFWKCLSNRGNERKAIDDVKNKYFNDLAKTKDLYLYLGTTREHHLTARNPFLIIGLFYPKKENPNLFT